MCLSAVEYGLVGHSNKACRVNRGLGKFPNQKEKQIEKKSNNIGRLNYEVLIFRLWSPLDFERFLFLISKAKR